MQQTATILRLRSIALYLRLSASLQLAPTNLKQLSIIFILFYCYLSLIVYLICMFLIVYLLFLIFFNFCLFYFCKIFIVSCGNLHIKLFV